MGTVKQRIEDERGEEMVLAAGMGKVDRVAALLAAGTPVDYVGEAGMSALMYAGFYGQGTVVELLLEGGAEVNGRALQGTTREGQTPLMQVAGSLRCGDRPGLIRRLVAAGAEIDAQDADGRTALLSAIDESRKVPPGMDGLADSVRALLDLGADPNLADHEGFTPLMAVVARFEAEAARPGASSGEAMEAYAAPLRAAGASEAGLESVRLLEAARAGDDQRARQLIAAGARVDLRYDRGSPLMNAAMEGHRSTAELLLAAGADSDRAENDPDPAAPDQIGFNPLLRAADGGHLDVVRLLVDRGADVTVRNSFGSALDYARAGQRQGGMKERPWDELIGVLEDLGVPSTRD